MLGEVKWIIEWTIRSSFFTLIQHRSVTCDHLSSLRGEKLIEMEDEEKMRFVKVILCVKKRADCQCWRTVQLNIIHINVLWQNCAVLYVTACEMHLHTCSLHHPPGISVPYLSKHTHSCVPCPSDGIPKKVNLWRVLSAAKIIHFDESVHILKVSSLKPFRGFNFYLDMK